jgi:predicted peptidase
MSVDVVTHAELSLNARDSHHRLPTTQHFSVNFLSIAGRGIRLAGMREILMVSICGVCTALGSQPEAREWTAPNGSVVKYRWSAPESLETGKTYPLVLFLHGAGERGDDNSAQLKHGVLPILAGADKLKQPCFLIAPQCPTDRWWSPINRETMHLSPADKPNLLLDAVLALVDATLKQQPVDAKRFYVTGLSMGGFATWDLLGRVPGRIAAAVPICGGGDPSLAAKFKDVPLHAFHGEADAVVPVRTTREMVQALEAAGGKPQVTYYPGVNHDSWTRTYLDPELIGWLFDQRQK